MIVELDLDGTLCTQVADPDPDYALAQPISTRIAHANEWFAGCFVRIKTGRGTGTGRDWRAITEQQLADWGVRYDELKFREDDADMRVDDKGYHDTILDLDAHAPVAPSADNRD